jgi:cellulose synthase/poly-beta-1,6-N-acetylglucosamine synthase-like glycosyltransferase
MKIIWWIYFFIVVYTYLGYGALLYCMVLIKRMLYSPTQLSNDGAYEPLISILVAAYNEEDFIEKKILNTLELDYPPNKLEILFITDGSTDETPKIVSQYPKIRLLHQVERQGKIAAVRRAMQFVSNPIVVFTDANTFLNKQAIRNIVKHYRNPLVGGVAGEKRIYVKEKDAANAAGEGIYWKYESQLKKWDSELYSVVGAAGELFSIRTKLFEPVPNDTIIEDFYITLLIAEKGNKIVYEPEAFALEGPSVSVDEELKRKIRIAAGGIQAIFRLTNLLNIFKHGLLSFQYISHRVLRWTLTPIALVLLFVSNLFLLAAPFFKVTLVLQILFYLSAFIGFLFQKENIKIKVFFIPYYFVIMNYAVFRGFFRFVSGRQTVLWERAQRSV